jgi:hypothetical protein
MKKIGTFKNLKQLGILWSLPVTDYLVSATRRVATICFVTKQVVPSFVLMRYEVRNQQNNELRNEMRNELLDELRN